MTQFNTLVEEMKNGDVVICDGLFAGKIGHIIGVGSSENSIKLLIDDEIERHEPDYALIRITEDNKKALALLVLKLTTAAQEKEEAVKETRRQTLLQVLSKNYHPMAVEEFCINELRNISSNDTTV